MVLSSVEARLSLGGISVAGAAGLWLVASTMAIAQSVDDNAIPNNGNDVTRPLHRLDLLPNFTRQSSGAEIWTTSLRYERPFQLADGWKIAFRVELPFVVTNDTSADNPDGRLTSGYGDTLMQVATTKEIDARNAFGFAARFIAPTASADQFGTGRWLMLPTAGYRYMLPEISAGSYVQAIVRYRFDFAGDPTRSHYSELQISPSLNVSLPNRWYVTLFPSTDVRYNFIRREWFVPFDFEIGMEVSKAFQVGLEIAVPMIAGDNPVYRFKSELHVTMKF